MNARRALALAVALSSLGGCGIFGEEGMFRNRAKDYLEARELPPLEVPADLDDEALGTLYPVPPLPETALLETFDGVPRPPRVSAADLREVIKIQRLGDDRWILSNRPPAEVWPRVRNILNRSGIPAARAEPEAGILETAWLEFKGDERYHHRYRFTIQPGVPVNSTEIRVLHDRVEKAQGTKEPWPERSVDPEREQEMVELLANALAGDVSSGTVSLQAQRIGGAGKVEFVTPAVADPYLLLRLDEDRAWASLAYSLGRGGFTVVEEDRQAGVFRVDYKPPEREKKGWFGRLFRRGGEGVDVDYLIRVVPAEEGVEVRVTDPQGLGLEREEALRILRAVRENLS
ncbi:MAG: hypothetical protein KatS3mg124_0441 [Porticoccaceae bacterium]|nr:MAG: hypothetical protein KatS3mg124_0441 [Porticoccaceae bacterium]